MTRAEAIKILTASDYLWLRPTENEFDALNMAIDALEQLSLPRIIIRQGEQEPSEDCISRKRLRESLKKELVIVNNNEMYWQGWHDCTVAVETRITDAPSVVPKGSDEE